MRRLDSFGTTYFRNVFLKIDAEGATWEVIVGATETLRKVRLLMIESAIIPDFKGEPTLVEDVRRLHALGFKVVHIERCGADPETGLTTRLDLICELQ